MAAKVELSANETAAAIVAAVFVSNWISAKYWSFPFAWCWGKAWLGPVLEPCLFVSHVIALGYFVTCVWTQHPIKIAKGLMVAVAIFGIPTFTEILLRLGKSCS